MSLYKRGGAWWYDFQVRGIRIKGVQRVEFAHFGG